MFEVLRSVRSQCVKGELLIAQVPISDFRPSTTSVYSGLAPNDFPLRLHFFSDLTDLTGSVMGTKCFVSLCGNYMMFPH